jgi:dolichol-phosphate mannosyltransferase
MKTPEVSIVVPTYEEAENIPELLSRIDTALKDAGVTYEVVVVDDYSGDGTEYVVERLRAEGYPLRLITRRDQRDLSSAVLRGFYASKGEILVCMDADLSHPPESLPALIGPVEKGQADFVVGSRYVEGGRVAEEWGMLRWLNSKVASFFARPLTRIKDPMSGFFALSRATFSRGSNFNPVGYKIGLELIVRCEPERVLEIPINFAERKRGSSKLSVREQLKYLIHIAQLLAYRYLGSGKV